MSLINLRGFSVKLCRQAFILAHKVNVRPICTPVYVSPKRKTHSGLYQMVKKRTLEARTKMSQQPINQPASIPNPSQTQSTSTLNSASSSNSPTPPPLIKGVKTSNKRELNADTVVCQNTKILGASGCQATRNTKTTAGNNCVRTSPPGCSDSDKQKSPSSSAPDCPKLSGGGCGSGGTGGGSSGGGGSGGGGGGKGDCGSEDSSSQKPKSNVPKALFLLLAALGAGGLLWMLGKKNDKKPVGDDACRLKGSKDSETKPSVPSSQLPKHVPYLLIGGGTAAFSAFRAIKSNDARAKVLMITNENRKPYMRPPLSKELWYSAKNGETTPEYRFKQWTGAERSLFFEPNEFFIDPTKLMENPNGGIAVAHGYSVKKIDPICHKVMLNDGCEIGYDQCLIATGCTPKNLPVFENASPSVKEKVMVYRTPEDFERLKRYADQRKSITIVGNGFVGSELACSLATYAKCKGAKIYQVFSESGNMSRVLPDYLSKWTTRKVEAQGVCVIPNASVRAAQRDESMLKVTLNNGNTLLTDVVVVCVGCDPNTSLANASGLEVHPDFGGFVVNAELEARHDLFVAGDASCFYDPLLGRRRVEHHDHSVVSGRLAGENMVGKKKPYTHQSMFWSDLGPEIGYEAIGLVDSSLPTVGIFALAPTVHRSPSTDNLSETRTDTTIDVKQTSSTPAETATATCKDNEDTYGKGVIFYLKNGKVVGILLWNLFNRIGLARTIVSQNKKYEDLNEVAKLFEIHS